MIIAREKRKQNIVEYLLYMFQVEDTIRACKFNMDLLEEKVFTQYKVSGSKQQEIRDWYADMMVMMHEENTRYVGHISLLTGLIKELNDLHKRLLLNDPGSAYADQYRLAKPNIISFEQKLGRQSVNEVDTCLNALYALLLLKLQRKEVSADTLEAMQTFSKLLAMLAEAFKRVEEGTSEA